MKVYLAAYEIQATSCLKYRVLPDTNVFLTYFYQKNCDAILPSIKKEGHQGLITIDSGAFSFLHGHRKGKTYDFKELESYFNNYLEWLKANKDFFDYFVELDLQEIIPYEKVIGWRRRLKDNGLLKKCITVYHACDSMEQFLALLDNSESGYIGMEGFRHGRIKFNYNKLISIAYKKQIKVHGFACTQDKYLYQVPFYSVDSSSWTASIRYGTICRFENGVMKKGKCNQKNFISLACHKNELNKLTTLDHSKFKLKIGEQEYRKMEKYFTDYWKDKGVIWKD